MPGTSKCSPALRACEWQHSALHGASMHRSHPQSGGDLALGCEPESKGIADISVSCDGLFDVGSAGVRRGAFIHAVARALATLAPSSWPTASEIVRLASRVFPECPVAAAVSFLIWGRIEGGARCAQTDASWFGARWGDVYQHVGDDTGLGRMVRLRLAPRVYSRMYSYAYPPLLYRDFRPAYFYGASFYRPRVWGWRSWGGRYWGWSGRRHWGWRGGWSGRHWGRRW